MYSINKEKLKTRKYVDISFTLDERIADGIYFANQLDY